MANVDQKDMRPTNKVAAAGVTAAAATVLVFLAGLAGVEMSNEVAGAFVAVAAFVGGFFKREAGPPSRADLKSKIEGS